MSLLKDFLYESVRLLPGDLVSEPEPPFEPSLLHLISPAGSGETPFLSLRTGVPEYAPGEFATALDFMQLSADEEGLWGAANPVERLPSGSSAGEVTIVHDSGGLWSQLFGSPSSDPSGENPFTKFRPKGETPSEEEVELERQNELVNSIAGEPGSEGAWVALTSRDNRAKASVAPAMVARVNADKTGIRTSDASLPAGKRRRRGSKGRRRQARLPSA